MASETEIDDVGGEEKRAKEEMKKLTAINSFELA